MKEHRQTGHAEGFTILLFLFTVSSFPVNISAGQELRYSGPNIATFGTPSQHPGPYCEGTGNFISSSIRGKCMYANLSIDHGTDYNSLQCASTNVSTKIVWWQVTFQQATELSGIIVKNRMNQDGNDYQQRLQNFLVVGLLSDSRNVTIYDDRVNHTDVSMPVRIPVTYKGPIQTVRILMPVNNLGSYGRILTLCEVEVYKATCPAIANPPNSNIIVNKGLNDLDNGVGAVRTINCSRGYKPAGNVKQQRCLSSRTWNVTLSCKVVTCETPTPITHGNVRIIHNGIDGNNYTAFSKQVMSCNAGYRLEGDMIRYCTETGVWNGTEPSCKTVTCNTSMTTDHGTVDVIQQGIDGKNYTAFATVAFSCDVGYRLKGDMIRYCNENGFWNGTKASCKVVECDMPTTSDHGTVNVTRQGIGGKNYTAFAMLSYSCDAAYRLEGDVNRYCTENGIWNGTETTCRAIGNLHASSSPIIAIAAGASAGGFLLVFTVVVVVVVKFRRSKQSKNKKYNEMELSRLPDEPNAYASIDEASLERTKSKKEAKYVNQVQKDPDQSYYSFSGPFKIPESAIKVEDLSDFVYMNPGFAATIAKQFQGFKEGLTLPHSVGEAEQNICKNRYKNVIPYDESRVVLTGKDSDYINASEVHGFNKVRSYIATQGPKKESVNDVWRMVWQQKSGKIVMLTKLIEMKRNKCEQYWPEEGSEEYGDFTVTLLKTDVCAEYTIRSFSLKLNKTERLVRQFHFTAWPDKGVPKYASSIVNFWDKVKRMKIGNDGPLIVHCSAGVGRTGTFMAVDYLMDQAAKLKYVDVRACVETMRRQRLNMVQTLDQYIFIHKVLVEALMLPSNAVASAAFPALYHDLLEIDDKEKRRKLDIEFDTLKRTSPVLEEGDYIDVKQIANKRKTRYPNILPVAEFMPKLPSISGDSEYDFINAVLVPSYKEENAFIVTQMPLESTIEGFWRLVYEYDVTTIVMMNDISEVQDEEVYWPEDEDEVHASIHVRLLDTEEQEHLVIKTMEISFGLKTRKVKQFQCKYWPEGQEIPKSPTMMLQHLELIHVWQGKSGNNPILVHCMNGAERSGLFCVVSAVLERMKVEQDVAIPQIIKYTRNRREQFIPNVKQFQFCHEAVLTYLKQFETYSNFSG